MPNISLATLSQVTPQPLAFVYLSQIPYTGLELGPVGTALYWAAIAGWSFALAYLMLFGIVPFVRERSQEFVAQLGAALNPVMHPSAGFAAALTLPTTRHEIPMPVAEAQSDPNESPEAPRGYSAYEGFKSFAKPSGALSIEDIVKGLTKVEPVYDTVLPEYEHVEPIMPTEPQEPTGPGTPPPSQMNANSFAAALVTGDRVGVFSALRSELKEGKAPEQFLSRVACLFDDAYRARIDGTPCDPDIARTTARLDTPTLEKLISALATAIDASYANGVTGAKLALIRALSVVGA